MCFDHCVKQLIQQSNNILSVGTNNFAVFGLVSYLPIQNRIRTIQNKYITLFYETVIFSAALWVLVGWLGGSVVERRSLTGEL